jgi:tetratricopeptide (TPR) repeat protein
MRVLTHHIPANAGNMQQLYKRKNRIVQTLCLLVFFSMHHLSALAQDTYTSLPIDTLIIHIPSVMRSDEAAARHMIAVLEKKSLQAQHRHGIVQTAFFKCWLKYRHEPTETTIKALDSALHNINGINADTICINFYILKGQCYVRQTRYDSAITSFRQALKIAESRNDQIGKNNVLLSIGWVYMEDKQSREAIHIFEELLKKNPSPQYENRTILLNNIAACYNGLQEFQHAEQYARQGIEAARLSHRNPDLANGLNILAHSCYKQGKAEEAVGLLKQAASVREKASDLAMLSADYIELANLYTDMHQPDQAITWALKAESIAQKKQYTA